MMRQLPNLLTGLRLALTPVAVWAIGAGHDATAFWAFAAAGASDFLDGFVARRFGLVSRFGALLDPAADKLLMLSCLVVLLAMGATPLWLVIVVVARDVAVVGGALTVWALSLPLRVSPLAIGKAAAAVQVGYVGVTLALRASGWEAPRLMLAGALTTAMIVAASGLAYGGLFVRALVAGHRTV